MCCIEVCINTATELKTPKPEATDTLKYNAIVFAVVL